MKNHSLSNLVNYVIDALVIGECKHGSKNRQTITKNFINFVKDTEIDIDFLKNNN